MWISNYAFGNPTTTRLWTLLVHDLWWVRHIFPFLPSDQIRSEKKDYKAYNCKATKHSGLVKVLKATRKGSKQNI